MQKAVILAVGAILVFGAIAQADDQSSGCGLGWQVTKRNSIISSYIRASTNATASNSSGMTSGTSGCTKHSIVKEDRKAMHYAEANYHGLMLDMARGDGQYLQAFATVLGCSPQAYAEFSNMTQQNYSKIFSDGNTTPTDLLKNVKTEIQNDSRLTSQCNVSA